MSLGTAVFACLPSDAPRAPDFDVVEATIADIHRAMTANEITARELVQLYLDRIEAYDKAGPAVNAIITVNPDALARADELDRAFAESGMVGPLHGIPVIVKDNYDTHDLPTTAGSLSLISSLPPDDAFQVRRIREAGAIVIAKSNMAEFAFTPYETVGSALPGHTRNPYALNRVPAGSSGGTAAGVAASFGAVGLGTDTGNSIRGPSAHTALVGIRSTMGLTSRDGIVPLYYDRDIGGPMARTVADAVAVFDVIAGVDPADPVTEASLEQQVESYAAFLDASGLDGARIGVMRQWSNRPDADAEVLERFESALDDMRRQGAVIVDPVTIPEIDELKESGLWCRRFQYDINAYLASLGPNAPVTTLDEIIDSRQTHPSIRPRLEFFQRVEEPPDREAGCVRARANQERLRAAVRRQLAEHQLDAMVYPTWSNPPRLIGDLNTPHGDNSQDLAPGTGFPAITVPMGYVRDGLPVGLQFFGDAWSEPTLIALAFAYEQATQHRQAPDFR
ncbi:MAG: amidase family protein [Gemmatimonadota bacterium]|nr:amidase family protein [Gemmatimonadota bacterium]